MIRKVYKDCFLRIINKKMILDEVEQIKGYVKRGEIDILNGIDSSAIRNKLNGYNERLKRLINSNEYKKALEEEKLK